MLTHTRPCPPPGAGADLATVSAVVAPAAAGAAAAAGLVEVFGLNKSASVFFAGEGDGLTAAEAAVVFVFRPPLAAGEAEASVVGDAAASAFLCVRCFAGDPAGDSTGAGDLSLHNAAGCKPDYRNQGKKFRIH